jgi:hypothetical protein
MGTTRRGNPVAAVCFTFILVEVSYNRKKGLFAYDTFYGFPRNPK